MRKELVITLDEQVYQGLHTLVGSDHISQFIESIVRRHVLAPDLDAAYTQMAQEEQRESEAWEWAEATVADAAAMNGTITQ